ncbi:MAG TPA: AzlC family ABC transporter permease, partial [Xanthobacteraceae bacterium]|nr:AzlC family ABC transporter permease [Xanthobacteraceae bacterium]
MISPRSDAPLAQDSAVAAFARGMLTAWRSVFAYVLFGTYIGIGALAHDFGFSAGWIALSTMLVWAAPAQVILISTLGSASLIEVALAVSLSSVRFMPMVVALLPMLRNGKTRLRHLILPAHLTAISVWVEAIRLLPGEPRAHRIAFFNGLATGLISSAIVGGAVGFHMAAQVPTAFAAGLLFLTPLSMLMSITRNSAALLDRLALALGLVIGPLVAATKVGLDLMWTGIIAGT